MSKHLLLAITEDTKEKGRLIFEVGCPEDYDVLDYGAFVGDLIGTVARSFDVSIEVMAELVNLRLKFNQTPREEIERKLASVTH